MMQMNRCTRCMEEIGQDERVCPHCGYEQNMGDQQANALRKNTILAGRYLIGNVIGQGGFGITYVGYDLRLEMKVAVKEYFPTGTATRSAAQDSRVQWYLTEDTRQEWSRGMERFFKEAKKMARLDSVPAIVRVRDVFRENETAYIVMDFVEGVTLKSHLLGHGVLAYDECVRLLSPIFDSLEVMHEHGFIHRDISPDNIMLQPDGTVRLLDMGAAVDVNASGGHVSMAVVKRYFSAPEQYVESETVGSWTDVYAMAATIYYCLTGKLPPEVMEREIKNTPIPFDDRFAIPAHGVAALTAALELDVEKRTKSMREFKEGLERENGAGMFAKEKVQEKQEQMEATGKPGILMEDVIDGDTFDDEHGKVLGSQYARNEIRTITFLDTLVNPGHHAWDVSANKNGEVIAWTEPNGEYYDLYIAGEKGVSASNCKGLFKGYLHVSEIHFNKAFDTRNVTDMNGMFYRCRSLTSLDASCFDTGNVTDMGYMFSGCTSLASLDVSSFDTGNVTDMSWMFRNCKSLTSLDVRSFDTGSVTNMSWMFKYCNSLTSLDVSGFDTRNVTDMIWMFSNCESLISLDVSGFDTGNVTDMRGMFSNCESLKSLDVSGFDTRNVSDMGSMFEDCGSLTSVDVSGFDTGNVTHMSWMFAHCKSLASLNVSGFDTGNVRDLRGVFAGCDSLDLSDDRFR